jgi:hypothetical protein
MVAPMSATRSIASLLLGLAFVLAACDADEGGSGETGETGPEECAPRPSYPEVYSSCAGAATCGVSGYACASQTGKDPEFNQAYCTNSCTMDSECSTIPECSAVSICVRPEGGTGICALECANGKQCPGNMMCLPDVTDGVTVYYCF